MYPEKFSAFIVHLIYIEKKYLQVFFHFSLLNIR